MKITVALLLSTLLASAQAQSVFRCEVDGRVTYQATDCPGGRPVTGEARAEADLQIAQERRRREQAQLQKEEGERRVRQAEIERRMVGASAIKRPETNATLSGNAIPAEKPKAKRKRKGVDPSLFATPGASSKPAVRKGKKTQTAGVR